MIYLADSNLICEPTKSQPLPQALLRLRGQGANVVIDAVVLGEIRDGIAALPDGRKSRELNSTLVGKTRAIPALRGQDGG